MKTKKLFTVASIFMIFLVLTLPVSASLDLLRFNGVDNFDGIVKSNDELSIIVTASLPDQDLTKNNIKLKQGSFTRSFDSCTQEDNVFTCVFNDKLRSARGKLSYDILLVDDGDNVRDSVSQDLIVDAYGASIKSLSFDSKINNGEFQINYVVEDYASTINSIEDCSGIERISIFEGDASGEPVQEIVGDLSCRMEGTIDYDAGKSSRTSKICMQAFDRFGQSSRIKCETFEVDSDAPFISNLKIERDNLPLKFIKSSGVTADISVRIDDVDKNLVFADLSALSEDNSLESRPSSVSGDVFIWKNVFVDSECEVTFSAEDSVGNIQKETLFCDFEKDDLPPKLRSIKSVDSLGNELLDLDANKIIGKEGFILVTFDEAGSGMNKSLAYLDLSGLGLGKRVRAKECVFDSGWKCTWPVRPKSSTTTTISVTTHTQDDLGNKFVASGASQSFIVDLDPPVIDSISHSVVQVDETLGDVIVKGDAIQFDVNASDFSFIEANLSVLGITSQPCLSAGPNSFCSFSDTITRDGTGAQRFITFTAYDSAGNTATEQYNISLFALLNDSNPNFWELGTVTCSPPNIDREIASLLNMRVYCGVTLDNGDDQNLETAGFRLGSMEECTAYGYKFNSTDLGSSDSLEKKRSRAIRFGGITDYFTENADLINTAPGSKELYSILTLSNDDFDIDGLYLTCPLYISTKITDSQGKISYTQYPEIENLSFDIGFYNNPAGEVSQQLYKKIDKAISQADSLGTWLDDVQTVFTFVDKMCQARGMIWDVINAVEIVINTLGGIVQALSITEIAGFASEVEALNAVKKTVCHQNQNARQNLAGDPAVEPSSDDQVMTKYSEDYGEFSRNTGPGTFLKNFLTDNTAANFASGIDNTLLKPLCDFANCNSARCPPDFEQKDLAKAQLGDSATSSSEGDGADGGDGADAGDGPVAERTYKGGGEQVGGNTGGLECGVKDIVGFFGGATGYDTPGGDDVIGPTEFDKSRVEGTPKPNLAPGQKEEQIKVNAKTNPNDGSGKSGAVFGAEGKTGFDKLIGASGSGQNFVSPKNSLFWALKRFCVPGVLNNLNKLQQIQCSYANCLGTDVKVQGVPVNVCDDEYSTKTCTYVANQVFSIFPQVGMWNYYMGMAQEIIANPAAAVAWVSGQFCSTLCDSGSEEALLYSFCSLAKIADVVGSVIEDVQGAVEQKEDFFEVGDSECKKMQELKKSIKQEKLKSLSEKTKTKTPNTNTNSNAGANSNTDEVGRGA